ncbi:hypothetical protein D1815_20430 [Aquimarina sp. AD1]|uniref:hypothetical protein n=1 Tax=Aquimarina sp. (strain AD1) TaxID=1714848 RepID=UPI000E542F8C|nr:hypothetical protein [Aquimarina sp. AD1]AXT58005.1 hypothetical protein D1815_20430 [Aquimarina sp. AD1]RKN33147.1 hypothetical protein D7035_05185 [Aquimarina sp. AD1]
MQTIQKNSKLLLLVFFFICISLINHTSYFDQQTKLYLAIGCAVIAISFLIFYWSKKENRASYKNNTFKNKIGILIGAVAVTLVIYVYQMI